MATKNTVEEFTQKGNGIRQWLKRRYGVPSVRKGHERVTVEGAHTVTVYGCQRILVYSPSEVRLLLVGEELSVLGERLFCKSFSAGTVTVCGAVGGVLYGACRKKLENARKDGKA